MKKERKKETKRTERKIKTLHNKNITHTLIIFYSVDFWFKKMK